jgi:ubiquitin C-terminal hydrolase
MTSIQTLDFNKLLLDRTRCVETSLSLQDKKIYNLVVFSTIVLIATTGFLFLSSSFVAIGFFALKEISWLAGTSLIAIYAGVGLYKATKTFFQKVYQYLPGLNNRSNNCWANALMHFILHIPVLRNAILNTQSSELQSFKNFVLQYHKDIKNLRDVSLADSQNIREALSKMSFGESINSSMHVQEDAGEALGIVLSRLEYDSLDFPELNVYRKFSGKKRTAGIPIPFKWYRKSQEEGGLIILSASQCKGVFIQDLFDEYFNVEIKEKGPLDFCYEDSKGKIHKNTKGKCSEEHKRFTSAPQDIVINMKRFVMDTLPGRFADVSYRKITKPLKVSETINLLENVHLEEGLADTTYEITSFLVHRGSSLHGGHYVAYAKVNDKWLLFNDSVVSEASEGEMAHDLRRAYFYHYSKVSADS